jgi:HK97 family phage major capsid protein/HK97 family phage prohead protease
MPTLKTGPQYRHFALDRAALDVEARTVALAFSSEQPYERYFGTEVLDHTPQSIRLDRLTNGGPLLVDHDPTDHVGVIEGVELGADRVGRAVVRFGRSTRAQEVFQDVQDGIRRHISVGYVIHKLQAEKSGDAEVMRAVDWEPLEVSIVSVPADPSVGIGRSAALEIDTEVMGRDESEAEAEDDVEVPIAPVVEAKEESAIDVRDNAVIEVVENTADTPPQETRKEPAMSQVDLSSNEVKQYSYARAIAAALGRAEGQNVSGFEVEVSQDIERNLPANTRGHGGIYVPLSLQRTAVAESLYNTATKGAETVFTEPGELIDMLRNQSAAVRLGARVMGGLMGPVSFPKQTGANTAYWMPENDGTNVTAGNATLGSVSLSPKTLQATSAYSRQLVAQSTLDVEQFIRADLAAVHALAWDKAVFHGAGASNEPDGLYHISGTNSVAMGGVPTFAKLIDMITEVNKDNALGGALGFVTTPGMAGKLAQTLVASAAGSNMIWSGPLNGNGNIAGYNALSTNQILATLGAGSEHGLLFGDWSQAMIGMWGNMEIIVDPYALKKQGMIEITSFQMCDIAFRHVTAFCKATGATIA